jgi:hypothetical protein
MLRRSPRAHCIQGGRLADKTYFLRPHDESTPDRFADAGTFRLEILVTRKGRYVDTCRTGRLRFTLRPV